MRSINTCFRIHPQSKVIQCIYSLIQIHRFKPERIIRIDHLICYKADHRINAYSFSELISLDLTEIWSPLEFNKPPHHLHIPMQITIKNRLIIYSCYYAISICVKKISRFWWQEPNTIFSLLLFLIYLHVGKLFGFRLPGLRLLTYRKQSLPQEDPDAVIIDSSKHSDDSVALKHFKSPTKESCSPSEVDDTKALIQPSKCSPLVNISGPLDHSSPKQQWDRLYPDTIQTSNPLTHSRSKESICSIRRASSVHDIEGFNVHAKNIFRDRHASEGMVEKSVSILSFIKRDFYDFLQ